MTWISAVSVRRRLYTDSYPRHPGCGYTIWLCQPGSVNLAAPYLFVVAIAIEHICRVPPDDPDRGGTYGHGTCVSLIGPSARDFGPLNGTDLDRDCSIVKERRSESGNKSYLRPYLFYSCLVATIRRRSACSYSIVVYPLIKTSTGKE